jgi:hypothetical protein
MTLLPILPVLPDETLTSYLRRVAKFHAGMDVYPFIAALDLSREAVTDPSAETLERIGRITGQSLDTLHGMVIRSVQPRIRALRQEQFHTEFANLKQTTFCPACLLEDTASDSPSGGLRVGRVSWRLEPVRTCAKHHIALVRSTMPTKSHKFQHMDEVAPDDASLIRLVESAERRVPSDLQRYVEDRLAGVAGPAWLDTQPIDIGVRACEMLGLLLTQPVTRKMPEVSGSELDTAGDVGFARAAEGEAGILSALKEVHERAMGAGGLGGHQQVFGFFNAWLSDQGSQKPKGPIRDIARDYVTENFAIEAGTMLFGEEMSQAKKHNFYTLARKVGANAGTVRRALVYSGMLDPNAARHSENYVFDAEEVEALFTRIDTALSNRELRKFLNCHRTQAEQLVSAGILPQVIAQGERGQNAAQHVARDDAQAFLRSMISVAQPVVRPTDGMCDIPRAARATGWSVVDIVGAVLAGRLREVECVDPELKFMGVLVNPAEIDAILLKEKSDDLVGFDEGARLLGIKRYGVRKFLRHRDQNGKPFLNLHTIKNAQGSPVHLLSRGEIEGFLDAHVALVEIASEMNCRPKLAKTRLTAAQIVPVIDDKGVGRIFYRRVCVSGVPAT